HTSFSRDWSSDVCSSDLPRVLAKHRATSRTGSIAMDLALLLGKRAAMGVAAVLLATGLAACGGDDEGEEEGDAPAAVAPGSNQKIGGAAGRERGEEREVR